MRIIFILVCIALSACVATDGSVNLKKTSSAKLTKQAKKHDGQGRFDEAEALYKQALAIRENELGPDHPHVATSLKYLAQLYRLQGRYGEAEPLFERSLKIRESNFGPIHPQVATILDNLAQQYSLQGYFGKAEPLFKRALAIRKITRGPNHPEFAQSLKTLASLYKTQGRYAKAEPLYKQALEIRESKFGPDHSQVATILDNLGQLHMLQGNFDKAEPLFKRALAIREKTHGPQHRAFAQSLKTLALLYKNQGRYTEAEPLFKQALAIRETVFGRAHRQVATLLDNLATLYADQGRFEEAEPLFTRALTIRKTALGPNHPEVGNLLKKLGNLYRHQGRHSEAERHLKRSISIMETTFGRNNHKVAQSVNSLANLYRVQGRYEDAEPLFKRALEIRERTLGPNHPEVAKTIFSQANLYLAQARHGAAEPLYQRALAIWEAVYGPKHPRVAQSFNNLAELDRAQGNTQRALENYRRASTIHRNRATKLGNRRSAGRLNEQKLARRFFFKHMRATIEHPTNDPSLRNDLIGEGFEAAQLANATEVGAAVSGMSARFAAGDDALAALVRERQDAVKRWRALDGILVAAVSKPPKKRDEAREAAMRLELEAISAKLKRIDLELSSSFPQFIELLSPDPVSLTETQALLADDEAMLTYLVWKKHTFIFALRRDRVVVKMIGLGSAELSKIVTELRKGLDPTKMQGLSALPAFDTDQANVLYRKLFKPVEPIIQGARHIFIVPDGALQSLPLGVLVTEKTNNGPAVVSEYSKIAWLIRKYAMTTLPSVRSLRALRVFAKRAKSVQPFLGIGDPKLEGDTGSNRGLRPAKLMTPRGVADANAIRQLASLPESYAELQSLARTLGAGDEDLMVGSEATETRVKQMALADYKVLAFATHGLIASDLTGLSEPALVLTPPETGSTRDDGLLTSSEVAQLKLDAEWVILSACNTAAADGAPGAEGLSGLAKAFFYAGSRALLVSHWPVASDAAVSITTRMLKEAAKPGTGRAEAHRLSILAMIENEDQPDYAHPFFWAPFVVVGEGGLGLRN